MTLPKRGRLPGVDRVRPRVDTGTETLVQQQFRDEVDIKNIVRRFGLGAGVPMYNRGVYGDFSGVVDYESAVAAIRKADDQFLKLPPEAREKFYNDPARFLDYAGRVSEDELIDYCGMRPAPVVVAVPPAQPAVAPAQPAP